MNPPCEIEDSVYEKALLQQLGWCNVCYSFTRKFIKPREEDIPCPECHFPSVYGLLIAKEKGYISVYLGDPPKPSYNWRNPEERFGMRHDL